MDWDPCRIVAVALNVVAAEVRRELAQPVRRRKSAGGIADHAVPANLLTLDRIRIGRPRCRAKGQIASINVVRAGKQQTEPATVIARRHDSYQLDPGLDVLG